MIGGGRSVDVQVDSRIDWSLCIFVQFTTLLVISWKLEILAHKLAAIGTMMN
jgi:hypothetical protein